MSDFELFFPIIKSELEENGSPVKISRPRILYIMLEENGEYVTPKNLKYFRRIPSSSFPLDLNLGYEDYIFRTKEYFTASPGKYESYLMKNNGRELLKKASKQQFCTTRNVLKSIMTMPFCMHPKFRTTWSIKAIKFKEVIFMMLDKKSRNSLKTKNETYHFKLHQYYFSDTPFKRPNTDEPIDENKQMSGIYRINLDDFEILYSAEIMGVESEYEVQNFTNESTLNDCRFVLTKVITDKKINRNFNWKKHPKMLTTWAQAFLSCVDKVYIGLRTPSGFVNEDVKPLETRDIPKDQFWKPEVCKRFLSNFLAEVQKKLENVDCPYTVYQFDFDSALKMVKCRVLKGKTEHSFLSEEFIQFMQKI